MLLHMGSFCGIMGLMTVEGLDFFLGEDSFIMPECSKCGKPMHKTHEKKVGIGSGGICAACKTYFRRNGTYERSRVLLDYSSEVHCLFCKKVMIPDGRKRQEGQVVNGARGYCRTCMDRKRSTGTFAYLNKRRTKECCKHCGVKMYSKGSKGGGGYVEHASDNSCRRCEDRFKRYGTYSVKGTGYISGETECNSCGTEWAENTVTQGQGKLCSPCVGLVRSFLSDKEVEYRDVNCKTCGFGMVKSSVRRNAPVEKHKYGFEDECYDCIAGRIREELGPIKKGRPLIFDEDGQVCNTCDTKREYGKFSPDKRSRSGYSTRCNFCDRLRRHNICGLDENEVGTMHIDHNHECCPGANSCGECFRRFLCMSCNTVLGFFKDDPGLLDNAKDYLAKARD